MQRRSPTRHHPLLGFQAGRGVVRECEALHRGVRCHEHGARLGQAGRHRLAVLEGHECFCGWERKADGGAHLCASPSSNPAPPPPPPPPPSRTRRPPPPLPRARLPRCQTPTGCQYLGGAVLTLLTGDSLTLPISRDVPTTGLQLPPLQHGGVDSGCLQPNSRAVPARASLPVGGHGRLSLTLAALDSRGKTSQSAISRMVHDVRPARHLRSFDAAPPLLRCVIGDRARQTTVSRVQGEHLERAESRKVAHCEISVLFDFSTDMAVRYRRVMRGWHFSAPFQIYNFFGGYGCR